MTIPACFAWAIGLGIILPVMLIIAVCVLVSIAGRGDRNTFDWARP